MRDAVMLSGSSWVVAVMMMRRWRDDDGAELFGV